MLIFPSTHPCRFGHSHKICGAVTHIRSQGHPEEESKFFLAFQLTILMVKTMHTYPCMVCIHTQTHLCLLFCLSFVCLRCCRCHCFCLPIPSHFVSTFRFGQRIRALGATTHSNPHINIYNIPSFQILLAVTTS